MPKMTSNHVLYYIFTKLVGAGFAMSIFVLLFTSFSSLNLFQVSELLRSPWLWVAFYGYGIFCSLIIDAVIKIWPRMQRWIILLYILAGGVVFIFLFFQLIYILIAATIGIFAALLFYFGVRFISKSKKIALIFAVFLPALLIFVSLNDFTKKQGWDEVHSNSSFEAHFTYFNGEHKIPINLQKGQALAYELSVHSTAGGWGNHFENEQGNYMPMEELDEDTLLFNVKEDGTYFIVVSGTRSAGRFVVHWEIID